MRKGVVEGGLKKCEWLDSTNLVQTTTSIFENALRNKQALRNTSQKEINTRQLKNVLERAKRGWRGWFEKNASGWIVQV